jgi:hypothetical protein
LKGRLVETRGFLQNVQPDEIASAQSHTYALTPPIVRGWFGGEDYIRHLVLPDFFHISIAHAILRHLGAKIGKRDYEKRTKQATAPAARAPSSNAPPKREADVAPRSSLCRRPVVVVTFNRA